MLEASAKSDARARVSKDEDGALHASRRIAAQPSLWTHPRSRRAATLLSMRAGAKHQPAAAQNECRLRSIVSGLLFTMTGATATCLALQRPSRIQVPARLPTRSRSPI